MARHGLSADLVSSSLYSMESGQAARGALVETGCTALIAASDLIALGVIRATRSRDLSGTDDVSVVRIRRHPDGAVLRSAAYYHLPAYGFDGPGSRRGALRRAA